MNMEDLFSGVAVVIDDEVNDSSANINKIISQIEAAKIPVLKYTSLPDGDIVGHFQNLSFLLLDWRLIENEEREKGVTIPDRLQEYNATENLKFIENLNHNCFCPVFIFTDEPDLSSIEKNLIEKSLYSKDRPNNIFIRAKNNFIIPDRIIADKFSTLSVNLDTDDKDILEKAYKINHDSSAYELDSSADVSDVPSVLSKTNYFHLFEEIGQWLEKTPSIYVLKEWEKEYQSCKTKLFSELHSINPLWPTIMWKNFETDGANKSLEMGELISRNLHSRMVPFEFKNDILDKESNVPRDELRKVLEGERFLKATSLHDEDIGTGDLFKEEYQDSGKTKFRYYLNIRAQCDLLRSSNSDKVEMYCLKGRIIDETTINGEGGLSVVEGQFIEKINNSVVPFLDGGQIIEFLFRDIKPQKWKDLKGKRVGRLLPPYINRIQQRYSLYMQRQGLPRIPDAAIFESTSAATSANNSNEGDS